VRRQVFVERELEARRGRKKGKVRLRFFKPTLDPRGVHWNCAFDIHVDGKKIWTPKHLAGFDGLQALVQAIGFSVFTLELFERDTGMRLGDEAWLDVWRLRPRIGAVGETKRRAAAVRNTESKLAEQLRRDRSHWAQTARPRRAPLRSPATTPSGQRGRATGRRERAGR